MSVQDAPSVWPALLAFAGVIALIPLALWMLKRVQGGGTAGRRAVTLVGGLALGPRERIAIVEAQGRRWMVGVTGQSISLLAELDASVPATAAAAPLVDAAQAFPPNPFAQLLDRLKRHG